MLDSLLVSEYRVCVLARPDRVTDSLVDITTLRKVMSQFGNVCLQVRLVKLLQGFTYLEMKPCAFSGVDFIGQGVTDQGMREPVAPICDRNQDSCVGSFAQL